MSATFRHLLNYTLTVITLTLLQSISLIISLFAFAYIRENLHLHLHSNTATSWYSLFLQETWWRAIPAFIFILPIAYFTSRIPSTSTSTTRSFIALSSALFLIYFYFSIPQIIIKSRLVPIHPQAVNITFHTDSWNLVEGQKVTVTYQIPQVLALSDYIDKELHKNSLCLGTWSQNCYYDTSGEAQINHIHFPRPSNWGHVSMGFTSEDNSTLFARFAVH